MDCNAVVKAAAWNLQAMIQESGASIECGPLPSISSLELPLVQLFPESDQQRRSSTGRTSRR